MWCSICCYVSMSKNRCCFFRQPLWMGRVTLPRLDQNFGESSCQTLAILQSPYHAGRSVFLLSHPLGKGRESNPRSSYVRRLHKCNCVSCRMPPVLLACSCLAAFLSLVHRGGLEPPAHSKAIHIRALMRRPCVSIS